LLASPDLEEEEEEKKGAQGRAVAKKEDKLSRSR
jgi:hypothetical protein